MHRSLEILEIVTLVCREIDSQSALASLARACKLFCDPALDELWKEQDTLYNIVRCMPRDLWEVPDEDGGMTLARPVLPADWDRALIYARRVKTFYFDDRIRAPGYPTTAAFLEILRANLNGTRITKTHFPMFAFFSALDSVVVAQCPQLKDVYISSVDELAGRCQSSSMLVLGLSHLRWLTIPSLDNAGLKHIGRLPNLVYLCLEDQSIIAPFTSTMPGEVFFNGLVSLGVIGTHLNAIVPLFTLLTHAPLAKIELTIRKIAPASATAECFRALARQCSTGNTSLASLSVSSAWDPDTRLSNTAALASYAVRGPHIRPLLSFVNVTKVDLAPPVGFDLDDGTIADLASAWPHIEELSLCSRGYANVPSHVTLSGLLPFAQYCPQLSSLRLVLDASVLPPTWRSRAVAKARVMQTSLCRLRVENSPVCDPLPVAAFLSGVFPNLVVVGTAWDAQLRNNHDALHAAPELAEALGHHKRWKLISAALCTIRTVRQEDQYWRQREERK
ncbi:hypothetical protein DFH06DRAFT_1324043 [Mycena polygramma]|nr:hypothetical protein DFH06DRAFT_1324043 [Mycena polygramma]